MKELKKNFQSIIEVEDFIPMRKKNKADDDLVNIPAVKSSIPQINGRMRLFIGKGNLVVQKLEKERPNITVAVKEIPIKAGDRVLILEAGDGGIGLVMAAVHPQAKFFLYNSDVSMERLSERNIEANFVVQNDSHIITAAGLKRAEIEKTFDAVIYCPQVSGSAPSSLDLIRAEVILGVKVLRPEGKFYLVTRTKSGASSHQAIMESIFGSNVTVIGRGGGGQRVLMAQGSPWTLMEAPSLKRSVRFFVCGHEFDLESEPSLFSKDDLDLGTRILLENVDLTKFERLLDVGCGWGAIGIVAATINKEGKVVMVDIHSRATEVANANVSRMDLGDRISVVATDDLKNDVDGDFDLVLSNPPFHANTEQLMNLFGQVRNKLGKKGSFYLVVERTHKQKLENVLRKEFGNVRVYRPEDRGFLVLVSKK